MEGGPVIATPPFDTTAKRRHSGNGASYSGHPEVAAPLGAGFQRARTGPLARRGPRGRRVAPL